MSDKWRWIALALVALAPNAQGKAGGGAMALGVTSPAFAQNGEIPAVNTCEGKDVSPPILWSGLPAGTKSVALIVDDPDAPNPKAPKMTWVHWVVVGGEGYALDTMLPSLARPTKAELERAMEGHVLARGELVGTYQKKGR